MESPCQELSNDTRIDIGSDRGAEDRPKLFPIMCVILSFTETVVLPVFVNFFEILHVFWFEKLIRGV